MAWTNPSDATAGEVLTAAFWNAQVKENLTMFNGMFTAFTAYTPALTALTTNPTLGTGSSASGAYMKVGRIAIVAFAIQFGTSGVSAGAGIYRVSLPSAIGNTTGDIIFPGWGIVGDASDSNRRYTCVFERSTDTTVQAEVSGTGYGLVTNSAPFTWAASDEIRGTMIVSTAT